MSKYLVFLFVNIFYQAQTGPFTLNGLVSDEQKKPIPNALILIKDNSYEYTLHTNEHGLFLKTI